MHTAWTVKFVLKLVLPTLFFLLNGPQHQLNAAQSSGIETGHGVVDHSVRNKDVTRLTKSVLSTIFKPILPALQGI